MKLCLIIKIVLVLLRVLHIVFFPSNLILSHMNFDNIAMINTIDTIYTVYKSCFHFIHFHIFNSGVFIFLNYVIAIYLLHSVNQ